MSENEVQACAAREPEGVAGCAEKRVRLKDFVFVLRRVEALLQSFRLKRIMHEKVGEL